MSIMVAWIPPLVSARRLRPFASRRQPCNQAVADVVAAGDLSHSQPRTRCRGDYGPDRVASCVGDHLGLT
jgi:hypothetical protein